MSVGAADRDADNADDSAGNIDKKCGHHGESAGAAGEGTKQRRECGGAAKVLMPMDGSAHTTARVRTSRRKYGCHGESVNSTAEVNVHQRKYIYRNKYRNKAAWVFRYHRYGDISASPKYGFSPPMRINSGPYSKGV